MPKRKLEDLLKAKDGTSTSQPKQPTELREAHNTSHAAQPSVKVPTNPVQHRAKRVKRASGSADVSKELSSLTYPAPQNNQLPKLPSNTTISKRPINHGPIASRFAGSNVPKVVYISRKTPVISAVKRVKHFLREIEKRTMQSVGVDGVLNRAGGTRDGDRDLQRKLEEVSERLGSGREEVLVKASGRAMDQALRVAEWFRSREDEMVCKVEVRTGSVSVVDDIVEVDLEDGLGEMEGSQDEREKEGIQETSTTLEVGDTTMELLGNLKHIAEESTARTSGEQIAGAEENVGNTVSGSKRRRKRKKKAEYDQDDVPEARLRWVKTVEVAISLSA